VCEIGEHRKQLDLIVTGDLEYASAYIKGQLGCIDDACKEQQIIPVDLYLKVRDVTLMLVIPTEDVVLYPGIGETLKYEPLGFSTVVRYRLQLIGRNTKTDDDSIVHCIYQAVLNLVVVGSIGLALYEINLE